MGQKANNSILVISCITIWMWEFLSDSLSLQDTIFSIYVYDQSQGAFISMCLDSLIGISLTEANPQKQDEQHMCQTNSLKVFQVIGVLV